MSEIIINVSVLDRCNFTPDTVADQAAQKATLQPLLKNTVNPTLRVFGTKVYLQTYLDEEEGRKALHEDGFKTVFSLPNIIHINENRLMTCWWFDHSGGSGFDEYDAFCSAINRHFDTDIKFPELFSGNAL